MKVNGVRYPSQRAASAAIAAIVAASRARYEASLAACDPKVVESCAVCGIGNHAASVAARRAR